jgi:RecB family endonuclease NucS
MLTDEAEQKFSFALEDQLRDFIAFNLSLIDSDLSIYVSDDGISGVEFSTEVGRIDILAIDKDGGFVVIELKLSRGEDATLGQIQRYMGWVKQKLAGDSAVRGVIIAKSISVKLKYAILATKDISLYEYTVTFGIKRPEGNMT